MILRAALIILTCALISCGDPDTQTYVVIRINSSEHCYIVRNLNREGIPIGAFARAKFERLVEEGGLSAFEWYLQE